MSKCDDCVYTDIYDWIQDEKTGKAILWCEKHKCICEEVVTTCDMEVRSNDEC